MAGIGNVQLGVKLTTSDIHNQRIMTTATGMGSQTGSFIWNPTSRAILKKEETDKQNDDNLIFLFEYRALLNARVQTLIAQLSNALASDLDVAMNANNTRWGGATPKPAMNGSSTNTLEDAGAARTAYNFMMGWMSVSSVEGPNAALDGSPLGFPPSPPFPPPPPAGTVSPAAGFNANFTGNIDPTLNLPATTIPAQINVTGTGTIATAQTGLTLDILHISNLRSGQPTFKYQNLSSNDPPGPPGEGGTAPGRNQLSNSFSGPLGSAAVEANAKNLFQKVLFDALSSVEFRPVLSSGLFKNLVIAASSSLPTGSQLQASFNLTFQGSQDGGYLDIKVDKMTAFYHS